MSRTGGPPVPDTTTVPSASVKTAAGVSSRRRPGCAGPATSPRRWCSRPRSTSRSILPTTSGRRLPGCRRSQGDARPGGASAWRIGIRAPPAGTARPVVGDHGEKSVGPDVAHSGHIHGGVVHDDIQGADALGGLHQPSAGTRGRVEQGGDPFSTADDTPVSATSTPSGLKANDVATSLAKKPVVIMRDQSRAPEELYLCSWMSCPSPMELKARYVLSAPSAISRATDGRFRARSSRHRRTPSGE